MGLEDPAILSKIEEIALEDQSGDWWDELPKEVQARIHEGHKDVLAGRVTPHEEAMERVRRKLGVDHEI